MHTLTITLHHETAPRHYPIYIGSQLLQRADLWQPHIPSKQVLWVSNETIAPLYLSSVQTALTQQAPTVQQAAVILPDGESYKTLAILNQVFDALLAKRFDRQCTLIALGGGVIGDMTGFAAACYQRGVHFMQIPTTLLAQVDASVGGKTGVNHLLGKNMIGAFYQPRAVVIDTTTLMTLPDRELRAGLAEVIKYGLIRDEAFFNWLENHIEALLRRDSASLTEAIVRSCQNKADIVALDERESGIRALLNLGHTFGHAIETATHYCTWLHGEAVAVGICMATDLSRRLGWIDVATQQRIVDLIRRAQLPTMPPPPMTAADFRRLMAVDKKVQHGQLRFILLKRVGEAVMVSDSIERELSMTLQAFCAS